MMTRTQTADRLSIVLLLVLPLLLGHAEEPSAVGKAITVRGKVEAKQDSGELRRLKLDAAVFREDTITTSKRGRAHLLVDNNVLITVDRDCKFRMGDLLRELDQAPGGLSALKTKNVLVSGHGSWRLVDGRPKYLHPEGTPKAKIGIR